jgi:murein DD-endopeptidase MepM/ murein hydrolase activator NlpD
MAGLRWPVWRHQLTQNFGGSRLNVEPKGWFVERDAGGPLRAFSGHFPGGIARPFVHPAIDIGLARGTHLVAVEDGVVKDRARLDSTHERYLILRIRPGVVAFYTHLKDWRVEKDQKVNRGDVIALSGQQRDLDRAASPFEVRIRSTAG